MTRMKAFAAIVLTASTLAGAAVSARASAFVAWEITNVPWGDTLNVRKYPASHSQKQAAYPNGKVLQMTGRCTGGVHLQRISGKSRWAQRQAVKKQWCEVWHDPRSNGAFVTGWVHGRYIRPY